MRGRLSLIGFLSQQILTNQSNPCLCMFDAERMASLCDFFSPCDTISVHFLLQNISFLLNPENLQMKEILFRLDFPFPYNQPNLSSRNLYTLYMDQMANLDVSFFRVDTN